MKKKAYCDLHTHTSLSGGALKPEELIALAKEKKVTYLAITDHNCLIARPDILQKKFPEVELISGAEISSTYFATPEKTEIHIIGLFMKQTDDLKSFLTKNSDDSVMRISMILEQLKKKEGIFIANSYADFKNEYFPSRDVVRRLQIAEILVRKGFCRSVTEAMDLYIGDFGKRRAWVSSPSAFASIEETVQAIHTAGGVSVLCHPKSYPLSDSAVGDLIDYFKDAGGDAMECIYGDYPVSVQAELILEAEKRNLLISAGSDYHGNRGPEEQLGLYPVEFVEKLRDRHFKIAEQQASCP